VGPAATECCPSAPTCFRSDRSGAGSGVGYLLYGLLDCVVDTQFESVQNLDDFAEGLEDELFDTVPRGMQVQRRSSRDMNAASTP
jgi:magnesium transporter